MGVLGQFRIQPRLIRSDSAIATLVERGLIAHNPHHLLVTTSAFLELAGLTDLSELPALVDASTPLGTGRGGA